MSSDLEEVVRIPTRSSFSTSSKIPTSYLLDRRPPRTYSCSLCLPHLSPPSGSLFRSIFPFAVRGISSRTTIGSGTMYSGSLSLRYLFRLAAAHSFSPTTYPTSRLSPLSSSLATTTLCLTPGARSTPPRSLPTRSGIPSSSPDHPLSPETRSPPSARYRPKSPVPTWKYDFAQLLDFVLIGGKPNLTGRFKQL